MNASRLPISVDSVCVPECPSEIPFGRDRAVEWQFTDISNVLGTLRQSGVFHCKRGMPLRDPTLPHQLSLEHMIDIRWDINAY